MEWTTTSVEVRKDQRDIAKKCNITFKDALEFGLAFMIKAKYPDKDYFDHLTKVKQNELDSIQNELNYITKLSEQVQRFVQVNGVKLDLPKEEEFHKTVKSMTRKEILEIPTIKSEFENVVSIQDPTQTEVAVKALKSKSDQEHPDTAKRYNVWELFDIVKDEQWKRKPKPKPNITAEPEKKPEELLDQIVEESP